MNYNNLSKEELIRIVNQKNNTISEIENQNERFSEILKNIDSAYVVHNADTSIKFFNKKALEILGLTEEQIYGNIDPTLHFRYENNEPMRYEDYPVQKVISSKKPLNNRIVGIHNPSFNELKWVEVNAFPRFENEPGVISEIVVTFIEITERINLINKLKNSEKRLLQVMDATIAGICITDDKGIFEYVNPAYTRLYKYNEEELIGNHFSMVCQEENREILTKLHDEFIGKEIEIRGEWGVQDKYLNQLTILADAARVEGVDGKFKKVTFVMDITERKRLETELIKKNEDLFKISQIDGLTQLYNHKTIFEKLEVEISRAKRYNLELSILMLDIDKFKNINDNYGHQKGDYVIKTVAKILKETVRETDICGRYGGEEFLVILSNTAINDAKIISERIRKNIQKYDFEGIQVTISGGISEFNDEEALALVHKADKFLYVSKETGRNMISFAN